MSTGDFPEWLTAGNTWPTSGSNSPGTIGPIPPETFIPMPDRIWSYVPDLRKSIKVLPPLSPRLSEFRILDSTNFPTAGSIQIKRMPLELTPDIPMAPVDSRKRKIKLVD